MTKPDVLLIAQVAHEANRAYCQSIGDHFQPTWNTAPDWQRNSAIEGVVAIQTGAVKTPSDSHEGWLAQKRAEGWTYGMVKDPERKEHPCMVDYDQLPPAQQKKDAIFFAVVTALLPVCRMPA